MKLTYILNARMPTERAHGLQTVRMCEALVESGVDVTLLLPRRWQNNKSLRNVDVFEYYGVTQSFPIRRIPHIDLLPLEDYVGLTAIRPFLVPSSLSFAILAALTARAMRSDLCFTREWMVAWWLVRLGLPTVYESHIVDDMSFSPRAWSAMRRAASSPNLVRIVTVTEAIKVELIRGGIPEEKVIVLSAGVDIRRYPLLETTGNASKNDVPVVLYTGSLYETKGVNVLAQAARHIDGVEVRLQGGPPEEYERLNRFVAEQGLRNVKVGQHMPPSDIPAIQQSADVLAYTPVGDDLEQLRYTSPIKLYEYMATGRPIVASDLPSIREVLSNEETALLVEPGNPEAVAHGVRRLLDNSELAHRLANNARIQVEQITWRNRVHKLLDAVNLESKSEPKVYA